MIKRYKSTKNSNPVVYVNIGDSINISCIFDSNLLILNDNNNRNLKADNQNNKNNNLFYLNAPSSSNDQFHSSNLFIPSSSSNSLFTNYKNYDEFVRKRKRRFSISGGSNLRVKHHHGRPSGHLNNKNIYDLKSDDYEDNDDTDLTPRFDYPTTLNKYELDWYFLDKNGHMNIISYGNQTKSRHKYKTFVISNDVISSTQEDLKNGPHSSALHFTQTHSRSNNVNRRNHHQQQHSNSDNHHPYTYYLNILIESESDEGVYQCINPDLPNFILRNVTVRLTSSSVSSFITNNYVNILYIFLFKLLFCSIDLWHV